MFEIEPMYTSADVRRTVDSTGGFYFSPKTMQFFDSRLLEGFWPSNEKRDTGFVVVSNKDRFDDSPRTYSVVRVWPYTKPSGHKGLDATSVGTFATAREAKANAKRMAEEEVK